MNTIILDWADNILTHKGKFELPSFAVAMEFANFDAAEEYLSELLKEEYEKLRGEYYIEEKSMGKNV